MVSNAQKLQAIAQAIGPTPWYWQTFPALVSNSRQRFVWKYQGDTGDLAYLVTLHLEQEPSKPRLALNTYCRPFFVPPAYLGIWCPEGRNIRLACFDPDQLKAFAFEDIVGWFKNSTERIYSATEPLADFEFSAGLGPGTHKLDVPAEFHGIDELLMVSAYPAKAKEDPAFAVLVLYAHAGLLEVLPQKWFSYSNFEMGKQWITRVVRDPESHHLLGDGFRIGSFELAADGQTLAGWLTQ